MVVWVLKLLSTSFGSPHSLECWLLVLVIGFGDGYQLVLCWLLTCRSNEQIFSVNEVNGITS